MARHRVLLNWKEFLNVLIISLIFAFIVSFREWGYATFDATIGFSNLLRSFIVLLLSLSFMIYVQKLAAMKYEVGIKFHPWWVGVFIGVFLAYFSFGYWWILLPGGITFYELGDLLIGKKKQATALKTMAKVAVSGPLLLLFLAITFRMMYVNSGWIFFHKAMEINIALMICTMLPLPQLERLFFLKFDFVNKPELDFMEKGCNANLSGFYLYIHKAWKYLFALAFIVAAAVMIPISENIIDMLLGPLLFGIFIGVGYFWHKI